VSSAGFGNLTPTTFDVLVPRGGFAQQDWPMRHKTTKQKPAFVSLVRDLLSFHTFDSMSEANAQLKERVRAFWQEHPCGAKFADAQPGTRVFYDLVEAHRYKKEWHIPTAAGFAHTKDQHVLEIGCGLGTDGSQFAKAGAHYTGVDLTEAAVNLARRHFELFNLPGNFRVADAEQLEFPDNTFDIVYSHGVLHHTPDTAAAVREVHRVLRPGGRAVVMLYHRNSYNYRVNISLLRRAGVQLLRCRAGLKVAQVFTGENEDSLREHARQLRSNSQYLSAAEFLNRNTDGTGNPLARVYSKAEARELFKDFADVKLQPYFFNKRWLPVLGPLLPRPLEAKLASRWGWHLWIYATK
jgi:ubiquinone/menaquinone biosynthesis C-methylase UbiE